VARQIVLLRGVNVGAKGQRIAMVDLRAFALRLGFTEAQTLLQSGNLVVTGNKPEGAALETLLETEAFSRLGLRIDFLVRTPEAWRAAINQNPYPKAATDDPSHLLIFFLKNEPTAGAVETLRASIKGRETLQVVGAQAYVVYPDGIGESKLTNVVIERGLGVRGTGRNWNTVQKLTVLAGA
jgi:uncharacterized protein (DUF1697 family)